MLYTSISNIICVWFDPSGVTSGGSTVYLVVIFPQSSS